MVKQINILKLKLLFLVKTRVITYNIKRIDSSDSSLLLPIIYTQLFPFVLNKSKLKRFFLKKSITFFKVQKFTKKIKKVNFFLFLNKFLLTFLEFFIKLKLILNLKKGSNKLLLKQVSSRKFFIKYFKKNLKITKQILGILYYSLLLKDSSIFVNFFKKILEKSNVKLHKKIFLGLKKILKDFFKPMFGFFGVMGLFFNMKGKIGVSGNAKKRRYYFYYGQHSITNRTVRFDIKHTPVWTFTGSLGFTFLIFF